jgi:membrane associated rhomboid family serine protease
MVDLNHIFLFVAIISPLLVLARAWWPGGTFRGWRLSALIVLGITGVSWVLFRRHAGYIGGGAWFALLFLPAIGLRRTSELAAQRRYKSARRLATLLQILHPSAELREQLRLLRALESRESKSAQSALPVSPHSATQDRPASRPTGSRLDQSAGSPSSFYPSASGERVGCAEGAARLGWVRRHRRLKNAPAVLVFIFLNIVAFVIELTRGGLIDPEALHRLGALDPYSVIIDHEYWRLFTALFLHYGAIHLLFNLFALYVLGPALERTIGSARFGLCYVISGLGSTSGVILLTLMGLMRPAELVGASGCVMGIVGAWAGFLLRHRHAPRAKERLLNILLIVAIQIVFDISTPQVSMAAHLCGLVTGLIVGLLIAPREGSAAA